MKRKVYPPNVWRTRLITLAFILAVTAPTHQAIGYYKLIDLGTLGGKYSEARSINNYGQIVGWADDSSRNERATLFDPIDARNNTALGYGTAYSINNNGQAVGSVTDGWIHCGPGVDRITHRAILYDTTGGGNNINLGRDGDGEDHHANSINDNGQIVGFQNLRRGSCLIVATLFDSTGNWKNNMYLGTLPGYVCSEAQSINNCGQIVGVVYNYLPIPNQRATLFDESGGANNIDLGSLGGNQSGANSINDSGQIVGWANNASGEERATLFDPTGGGKNIDLGTLGGMNTIAYSINNNGQIVGWAANSLGNQRATLFNPTGGGNNIDLNTLIDPSLGWTLQYAFSINDNGWIVGRGINPAGFSHAYLLIPEPASALIMGLGGLLLTLRRRYR